MIFALDTNIVVKYLRNDPKVIQNLNDAILRRDNLVIPRYVEYEIRRGFRILPAPSKEAYYNTLTDKSGRCKIIEMNAWDRAVDIYAELYGKKLTIGEMDIFIAAICLENAYTLVTNNTLHFENIDGLTLVDWSVI